MICILSEAQRAVASGAEGFKLHVAERRAASRIDQVVALR